MTVASLLPANATSQERAVEAAIAGLANLSIPTRAVWSAADCPAELLPWLAWGLSIDDWDADWSDQLKRSRIAAAIPIQRRKGTAKSVRDVVASFGGNVIIREWFEMDPPGEPHTFSLTVTLGGGGSAPTAEFIDTVISEVGRTKPVRSRFDFTIAVDGRARIGLRAVGRPAVLARLWCQAV